MSETPYRDVHESKRALAAPVPESAYRPLSRRQARLRVYAPAYTLLALIYFASWQGLPLFTIGIVGQVFGLLVWRLIVRRRAVKLVRGNEEGVALLNAGDLDGAAAMFDGLAREARSVPLVHALIVFNRGAIAMREGEIDRAIELIDRAVKTGFIADATLNLSSLASSNLGTCHAIKGELDAAERWQREAHAAAVPSKRGSLMVLDAIVACRRGRFADAASKIAHDWNLAEGGLNAAQLRSLRLLRAFALENSEGDPTEIDKIVEGAKPFRPGEQDYLAGSWPEFRAFLVKRGFAA